MSTVFDHNYFNAKKCAKLRGVLVTVFHFCTYTRVPTDRNSYYNVLSACAATGAYLLVRVCSCNFRIPFCSLCAFYIYFQ